MFIKLYCNTKIHKISKIPETFSDFCDKVCTIFASDISSQSYTISYEDEEGDKIALTSDDDYQTMISTDLALSQNNTIKVFINLRRNSDPDVSQVRSRKSISQEKTEEKSLSQDSRIGNFATTKDQAKPKSIKPLKSILKNKQENKAPMAQKKDLYLAKAVNDCKSVSGDKFEITKDSLITITRFLQAKGQVEAEYNGLCGIFNLKDVEIQTRACSYQAVDSFGGFRGGFGEQRVQIGF